MSTSGYSTVDERELALQRILRSKTFATGETMRHILEFIVTKSLAERADEIKEYTIATEALGRSPDFNPKEDNIVRVQVNRLRKKLDEYYGGEGARDPLRISIPLGHYYPDYLAAPLLEQPAEQQAEQPVVSPEPAERQNLAPAPARTGLPRAINWQWLALGLLVLNLGLGSYLLWRSHANAGSSKTTAPLAKSLAALWQPFIATDQPPLIIYSNALFLMSEQGDLYRYYAGTSHSLAMGAQVPSLAGLERRGPVPGGVGPLYYFDSYTGIGEVVAAGRLAQLLARGGQDFLVKRSRITSYEDIRNRQVIFLGTSVEDALLGKLPVESELVFEEPTGKEFVGRLLIRDRHPAEGKPATYEFQRDAKTKAL